MNHLFRWLYAAVPITLVLLSAYVLVQQNYRESLNDPQIEMAEDAAAHLSGGASPAEVMPLISGESGARAPSVDIAQSLAPWLAVFDASGAPLESSGSLGQASLKLPPGVFDTSKWIKHPNGTFYNQGPVAETRFTWEPKDGVRQAVVLIETPDKKYFVAAGRNMREVEQRIEHEGELVFVAWLGTLAAFAVLQWVAYVLGGRVARHHAR